MTASIRTGLTVHFLLVLAVAIAVFGASTPVSAQDGIAAATPTPGPPVPPLLIAPADGAVTTATNFPPLGMPTFRWMLPGAASISHIQISTTPGFSSSTLETDTYGDSYTPITVWVDGTYYWRVKVGVVVAQKVYWGAYSDTFSFDKDWTNNKTIKPTLIAPKADAVRTTFEHGDFSWSAIPGAAGYMLEISTDPAFNDIVYQIDTLRPEHMPDRRFASNVYFWRVTPFAHYDGAANRVNGTPSEPRQFTINWSTPPQLLSPADNTNQEFVPRFQWTAVEGAEHYRLEVSTDTDFNPANTYTTRNTDFTPIWSLANDKDYYWRIKAYDHEGNTTQWSQVRLFHAKWNFAPQLLTPTNNQIQLAFPYFSWVPVPGAEAYQIQIDQVNVFNPPGIANVTVYNVTDYTQPQWNTVLFNHDYFWRVRAIDAQGNYTPWSETWAFQVVDYESATPQLPGAASPNLVYPPQYFAPDEARLPVHRDPLLPSPVFVWDTTHLWLGSLTYTPDHYKLLVDDDPAFGSPNFTLDKTRTLAAAPTTDNLFTFASTNPTLYYWLVRAYWDADEQFQMGTDVRSVFQYAPASHAADSAANSPPVVIYPRDNFQAVASPPVLGWNAVAGASTYHVQLSRRPDFTILADEAHAQFINYVPWQGRIVDIPFGIYWWRVRAESSPNQALTDWSEVRSFGMSIDLLTGNPYDLIPPAPPQTILESSAGYDPVLTKIVSTGAAPGAPYEMNNLHIMLDRGNLNDNLNWVIAFQISPSPGTSVRYGLYFDIDHTIDGTTCGSARSNPPASSQISSAPLYQPERAIYVDFDGSDVTNTNYLRWNALTWNPNCAWAPAQKLNDIGGAARFDAATNAIQILVPYTALGGADDNFAGSLAFTVFSTSADGLGFMADSLPLQGEVLSAPNQIIDSPAFVSDMLLPLFPFDTPLSNPSTFYDMPAVHWRTPVFDSVDGFRVQVAKDERFSQVIETWETYESGTSPIFALLPAAFQSGKANDDNESYYWRVQIRHERYTPRSSDFDYGPWSPPLRFKLDSRVVTNPALSTGPNVFMTPTFTWDRVEGAAGYTFQLDDDDKFSTPLLNTQTDATSFTPDEASYGNGLQSMTQYYWRVRMRRSDSIFGQWTTPQPLVKTSIAPVPEYPRTTTPLTVIAEQPTFKWNTVLTPTVQPRLATPRYRLQVDDDPNFASINLDVVTEGTSYTPPRGKSLADGQLSWRVAIYETSGKSGPFSPAQHFVKQYPRPNVVSPQVTSVPGTVPVFSWQPAVGAAYYILEISKDENFQSPTNVDTTATTHTPIKKLLNGQYFWRVRMYDQDKVPGPIEAGQFTLGFAIYLPSVHKPATTAAPK